MQLQELEKEEQNKPNASRKKEIINRTEMSKIKNRKITEKTGKTQSRFFQKINKADKHLASLTKGKKKGRRKYPKPKMKEGTLLLILWK